MSYDDDEDYEPEPEFDEVGFQSYDSIEDYANAEELDDLSYYDDIDEDISEFLSGLDLGAESDYD